jgi:hypothetical protein
MGWSSGGKCCSLYTSYGARVSQKRNWSGPNAVWRDSALGALAASGRTLGVVNLLLAVLLFVAGLWEVAAMLALLGLFQFVSAARQRRLRSRV